MKIIIPCAILGSVASASQTWTTPELKTHFKNLVASKLQSLETNFNQQISELFEELEIYRQENLASQPSVSKLEKNFKNLQHQISLNNRFYQAKFEEYDLFVRGQQDTKSLNAEFSLPDVANDRVDERKPSYETSSDSPVQVLTNNPYDDDIFSYGY